MRIVVLSNLYPPDVLGGYEIACAQAVDALRQRGHRAAHFLHLATTLMPRNAGRMCRAAVGAFDEIQVSRIHRRIPHPHSHLMPFGWRERAFMEL